MVKASEPYVLSFTAASVCLPESVRLAELYAERQDWDATREVAIANNVIQARKTLIKEKFNYLLQVEQRVANAEFL